MEVEPLHLLLVAVCVVLGFVAVTRGSANNATTTNNNNDNDGGGSTAEGAKKKRKRKKKKKKKKKTPEPEPEIQPPSSDDESSNSSDDESEEEEAPAPAPVKTKKNKNKNKNKNKSKNQPALKNGSAKAASKKAAQKQKPDKGFKTKSTYNPTPEDARKRREREEKRRLKQQQQATVDPSKKVKRNPEAVKQAGKITKKGIVGLSRTMTSADKAGSWEKVGGASKKKSKGKVQMVSSADSDPAARVVVVPTSKLGMIIGSGGLTLRKIEAETGATISMPQQGDANVKAPAKTRVTIRCDDEEMLREAVQCVSDLVTRGHSDLLYRGTDTNKSVFKLAPSLHHVLVGKGGATIRAIQDKSKCKVVLPTDKQSSKITIIGDKQGVAMVKEALKQIDTYYYSSLADSSLTHAEVEISESELGYIIGYRGQVIKSIQGDTHTKIFTPGQGKKNRNVVVVGTAPNIARALKQIQRNIDKNTY